MTKIVETNFGTLVDQKNSKRLFKKGAFFDIENDDVREYSFTDRARAEQMRQIN